MSTAIDVRDSASSDGAAPPSLIDVAKKLARALRERTAETNRLRRLPDATWRDLIDSGTLRGLQPSRWGGGEVHLKDFYGAAMEVARAEGCAGWIAGVVGVHPWQMALFARRKQEEFGGEDPTVMFYSSYVPTVAAERVADGFHLRVVGPFPVAATIVVG